LISECAAKVGFAGGVVVDYPNSAKAKKHYLVLSFDRSYKAPKGLSDAALLYSGDQQNQVRVDRTTKKGKIHRKKKGVKTKEWIVQKKDTQRRQGKDVRPDTRFTGRKRKDKF
jgi:18S rRNA (guanine1575-N7)-methyltransferase